MDKHWDAYKNEVTTKVEFIHTEHIAKVSGAY